MAAACGAPGRRRWVSIGLVAVAAVYAARLVPRLAEFRDDETLFRAELARTPDFAEGLTHLARHYDRQGRFEEAAGLYERALRPDPARLSYFDLPKTILAWSSNLLARGRVDEAARLLEDATAESTGLERVDDELAYNLAVARLRQGRQEEALAGLDRYARRYPDDPSCRFLLGRAAAATGDSERAARELRRYLELAPDAPDRSRVEAMLSELTTPP